MSTIGYYNYYNNPHRYTPQTPHDRYQEMVERYEANKTAFMLTTKTLTARTISKCASLKQNSQAGLRA